MLLLQQSDVPAFEELYARYSKRLLHFMFRLLNNDEEKAQDLLQDIFLKLVERPQLFDASRKFYTWIFTVAANMCRTAYRNQRTELFPEDADETEAMAVLTEELIGSIDASRFTQQLGLALDRLSYEQRETFVLRFQEGFSINEIAGIMNCSTGTVKSRIYYTTRKLAVELDEFKLLLKK